MRKKPENPIKYNPNLGDLDEFIQKNKGLVHQVCQKLKTLIKRKNIEYDEIAQIGFIGLMKAYEKFDPNYLNDKGETVKISTYAIPSIRGEIMRFLRDYNEGAKFSRSSKEMAHQIVNNGWQDKTPEEIAELAGCTVYIAKGGLDYLQNQKAISIQKAIYEDDGDEITLEEKLPSNDDYSSIFVEEFLDQLDNRSRKIVEMRLSGWKQQQIGDYFGLSQVQVSRILVKIQEALMQYMEGKNITVKIKETRTNKPQKEGIQMETKSKKSRTGTEAQGDIEEAKRLLAESDYSYKEIAKITGAKLGTIGYYGKKIRKGQLEHPFTCVVCGKEDKSKSKRRKYCSECRKKIQAKRVLESRKAAKEQKEQVVHNEVETKTPVYLADEKPKTYNGANVGSASNRMIDLKLKGDVTNISELMEEFSKAIEMLQVYEAADFEFSLRIVSKELERN